MLDTFQRQSDFDNLYNFLSEKPIAIDDADFAYFVQSEDIRQLLHVGDAVYESSSQVYESFIPKFMTTIKPWLEELVEKYRYCILLFYF